MGRLIGNPGIILDKTIGIRVSRDHEISGMDLLEHGEQAYGDTHRIEITGA